MDIKTKQHFFNENRTILNTKSVSENFENLRRSAPDGPLTISIGPQIKIRLKNNKTLGFITVVLTFYSGFFDFP